MGEGIDGGRGDAGIGQTLLLVDTFSLKSKIVYLMYS